MDFKSDGKAIMIGFIGVLIAVVLIGGFGDTIFPQTNTLTVINATALVPAVNGTTDLTGRTLLSTPTNYVLNESSTSRNLNENVTLRTAISSTTGLQTVQLFTTDNGGYQAGLTVNVTYGYEPDGYANNSGTRGITNLILIFSALAIVVFLLVEFMGGSLGKLMRSK